MYPNSGTGMLSYISGPEKGDGYYGNNDGLHTVMYTCSPDFIGTVTMQATLATAPANSDWFNIVDTKQTYTQVMSRTTSTVDIYNFTGNFVWVRGVVNINHGQVQSVLYNH
jgi:hypothetical protein